MKYSISDKAEADAIWDDDYLNRLADADSKETVLMRSVYFDTADRALSQRDIAFRVRMEGTRIVASLKWNGNAVDGLHVCEEVNVPVDDPNCFIQPSPDIFKESEAGRAMIELIGDKPLTAILEVQYLRRRMRLDDQDTIMEVAIDTGEILTENGNRPICELEIELFSGDQETVRQLGAQLKERYNLVEMNTSKYARGIALLK
ncbi:MAG TPA: CYTH domain-containing protein [Clostridiales bacterium]|nr:CYTH domain-containing protein [Clostridiales bacterium]